RMFLGWYEDGLQRATPQMPAPGYKWSELQRLNRAIWEKHRSRSQAAVRADFDSGYRRIVQITEALSPEPLLESGQFEWTGKNPLTSYIGPNTASHYRFALKVIKRWLKTTAAADTDTVRPNKRLQPTKAQGGTARKRITRPRLRG
ncbi:MAG: ClbS/DfsB family four-helix bundle protein, partial [Acidobacteria bacterium]|nr:ClbS/DfsB family four-helix bundle protein [Acidobacteriota bacterium]